jgi:hypothetical protein
MNDAVGITSSPFTMMAQVQRWPGADYWKAEVSLPQMSRANAAAWIAWLGALRGKANVFQLSDKFAKAPQGNPLGTPVIDNGANSGNQAMSTSIATRGWTAGQWGLLLPGDYIQIGYRLHVALEQVNSDSNGKSVFQIWPSLREQPVDGSSLILNSAAGIFRLDDNARKYSISQARTWGISFKCNEAR